MSTMFIVTLPSSKETFSIKKFTFENMFDVARLLHDNNSYGFIKYIESHFDTQELNMLDKFYVIVKARELFINELMSLELNGKNVAMNVNALFNNIYDTPKFNSIITSGNISLELDVPYRFIIDHVSSIYSAVISKISIVGETISYKSLSDDEQHRILESLPPTLIKNIVSYITNTDASICLFEGNEKIGLQPMDINLFSNDPFMIIKTLYSEYGLLNCREILFHLSKKISSESLLKSTVSDIKFYLDEYNTEVKNSNKTGGGESISL